MLLEKEAADHRRAYAAEHRVRVARVAQEQGAEVVLTSFGKAIGLTQKSGEATAGAPDVLEMDANDSAQIDALAQRARDAVGELDGFLHAIAFAPQDALGGKFLNTPWESVATAFQTSAYLAEGDRRRHAAADAGPAADRS